MRQGERTDLAPSANLPKVSQADAAKLMGISGRSLRSAKTVSESDTATPELVKAMEQGKIAPTKMQIFTLIRGERSASVKTAWEGRLLSESHSRYDEI